MTIARQYIHDRWVLLVLSINIFLVLLLLVLTLLRIDTNHSSYIIEYRSNAIIDAFKNGSSLDLYSFPLFGVLALGFHTFMSYKIYRIHRYLSTAVLSLGTVLLVVALLVSNALLMLR